MIKGMYPLNRGWALVGLIPHLSAPLGEELLSQCLVAVHEFEKNYSAEALRGLPPFLPKTFREQMLHEALAAARELPEKYEPGKNHRAFRAEALAGLISYLPEPLNTDVAEEVLSIIIANKIRRKEGFFGRTWVITEIAPYLPQHLLKQALITTWTIEDDWWRAVALAKLANYLPPSLNAKTLEELLTVVTQEIEQEDRWGKEFADLVPYLPDVSLQEVLEAVPKIEWWDTGRADMLIELARRLSKLKLQDVLTVALQIRIGSDKVRTLVELTRHLPPELAKEILPEIVEEVASLINGGIYDREKVEILKKAMAQLSEPLLLECVALVQELPA